MDKCITDIQAREAFYNALEKHKGMLTEEQEAHLGGAFCAQIRDTPPADVVVVVHCEGCAFGKEDRFGRIECNYFRCEDSIFIMPKNGYCSRGITFDGAHRYKFDEYFGIIERED